MKKKNSKKNKRRKMLSLNNKIEKYKKIDKNINNNLNGYSLNQLNLLYYLALKIL